MITFKEFLKNTHGKGEYGFHMRPMITCADGFSMSVQGSEGHYCEPRSISLTYVSMEIGYPSEVEPLLLPYQESSADPTESVYGYVPVEVIEQVINKHGGIATHF